MSFDHSPSKAHLILHYKITDQVPTAMAQIEKMGNDTQQYHRFSMHKSDLQAAEYKSYVVSTTNFKLKIVGQPHDYPVLPVFI
jgi:hypothetical protein